MSPQDRWFALIDGLVFVVFSDWFGRELATKLEGRWTSEERAAEALNRRRVFGIIGAALIGFAIWKFIA